MDILPDVLPNNLPKPNANGMYTLRPVSRYRKKGTLEQKYGVEWAMMLRELIERLNQQAATQRLRSSPRTGLMPRGYVGKSG